VRLIEADRGTIRMGDVDYATQRARAARPASPHPDDFCRIRLPRQSTPQGREIISDGPIAMAPKRPLDSAPAICSTWLVSTPERWTATARVLWRTAATHCIALRWRSIRKSWWPTKAVSALDVLEASAGFAETWKTRLGLSMLFITHDLRVAAQICDRIAVRQRGVIVEPRPPDIVRSPSILHVSFSRRCQVTQAVSLSREQFPPSSIKHLVSPQMRSGLTEIVLPRGLHMNRI